MALPSITEVASYWSNRCLRCDAPVHTCLTCWENTARDHDGRRRPDCPHACRDSDHARYQTFCDSGEPECIACEQFLGVIPEVWEDWTEDGHDLSEDRWPYGPGDIRFKGRLLLMFGGEPTAENTAPFCRRCWAYLTPKAVTLDWLCEFRDRKALTHQPGTWSEWLPAEVREFYGTQMDIPEKRRAVLDDRSARGVRTRHRSDDGRLSHMAAPSAPQGSCSWPVHPRSGEGGSVRARRRAVREVRFDARSSVRSRHPVLTWREQRGEYPALVQ